MSFLVTKSASGAYRWNGISSTNARDRDIEIVSETALRGDVTRTKSQGDQSELWLFHVPYRLGGAPDFRAVVEGHLVESGEFDDTPVAKSIAQYLANNPDGPDGTGWGMSIGFKGAREQDRVFNTIVITERSILPLTKAANPFTAFQTGGLEMALTKQQQEFLDELANNPEVRDAAKTIIGAAEQSKALDTAGVERKSATPPAPAPTVDDIARAVSSRLLEAFNQNAGKGVIVAEQSKAIESTEGAQYAHGPGGISNQPGTSAPPKTKKKPAPEDDGTDEEDAEDMADSSDDEEAEGETADGKPKKKAASELIGLTREDLADLIDSHVKAVMIEPLTQIATLIREQSELLAAQQKALNNETVEREVLQKTYITPRIALQDMLASRAKSTEIEKDDPLMKAADEGYETSSDIFSELGFPKKGQ